MVLTPMQVRKFYDRFGRKQDTQAFYEDAGLDDLVAHANFEQAQGVFEFGCGTGRFACRLLEKHLSRSASYLGIDISKTMIEIARQHISPFVDRARVEQSGGAISFPLPDHSVDRVVSTYVLDLLSEHDIAQVVREAQRVLMPNGKLCVLSLTRGTTLPSRIVSALWSMVFHIHAPLVGGCRPLQLEPLIARQQWTVEYRNVLTPFTVPSEVVIAIKEHE